MGQYIDKSVLVTEIDNILNYAEEHWDTDYVKGAWWFVDKLQNAINTLEVKEVKEPTASDRGMAEEIITNLKRIEQDYHIDLTREIEWTRNKAQKE